MVVVVVDSISRRTLLAQSGRTRPCGLRKKLSEKVNPTRPHVQGSPYRKKTRPGRLVKTALTLATNGVEELILEPLAHNEMTTKTHYSQVVAVLTIHLSSDTHTEEKTNGQPLTELEIDPNN